MRSRFAYMPRPGPLQAASPGAAVLYLGSLVAVAFLYSSPIVLAAAGAAAGLAGLAAGARGAVRAALRMSLAFGLPIVAVNGLVTHRGETVLLRLGEWPLLGRVDVTAEALAAGAAIGLRAAATMVAFAVYSACVDPDRVLRALRPFAGRSALTASLVSRLVPVAAADAARLRDAGRLRGPGAAPLSRAALARRLLAGSLDRAVDVAAALELRGYGLPRARLAAADAARGGVLARPDRVTHRTVRSPHRPSSDRRERASGKREILARLGPALANRTRDLAKLRFGSRYDRRFHAVGAAVLVCAVAGKALGADGFAAYPSVEIAAGPLGLGLSALMVLAGLAPLRRRPRRRDRRGAGAQPHHVARPAAARSTPPPEASRV